MAHILETPYRAPVSPVPFIPGSVHLVPPTERTARASCTRAERSYFVEIMSPAFTPLGVLEEQIIVAVLRTRGDAYGMHVRREIEQVTGRELAIGAVYATLDRLESKGLLHSRRVRDAGASRRLFEVTPDGARTLAETRAMRERLWKGVDARILLAIARR